MSIVISDSRKALYKKIFINNLIIAESINDERINVKSSNKCVSIYLHKRKIVSIGINTNRGNLNGKYFIYDNLRFPKEMSPKFNTHSELDGYIKILRDNKDFDTILNYRGDNARSPSKPCLACSKWLRRLNNINICYINNDFEFEYCKSNDLYGHINYYGRIYNVKDKYRL